MRRRMARQTFSRQTAMAKRLLAPVSETLPLLNTDIFTVLNSSARRWPDINRSAPTQVGEPLEVLRGGADEAACDGGSDARRPRAVGHEHGLDAGEAAGVGLARGGAERGPDAHVDAHAVELLRLVDGVPEAPDHLGEVERHAEVGVRADVVDDDGVAGRIFEVKHGVELLVDQRRRCLH
ncbi:oligoendopeptidase F [Babesia caballi]|uniref:Oligoendopeptidase F n=1 Tax=Babesia caballi TaxID=5871 RepID=A0AAV4LWC9_BABCB|nr:oligoendopeptidase F [Babesia caballi]